MELKIQKWVRKTKPFMKESEELFNEAIECYKVGANRAAFLMSYLAFEKAIQERVLNFNSIPNGLTSDEFEDIKNKLQDDDEWENAIFKNIILKNKIMNLPNKSKSKIQQKLQVYKLTRNSCTHANGETINSATVEEFWNFLKDNIAKFNVNGGIYYFKEALFKAFRDRNEDIDITYDNLLESLPFSNLRDDELIELWDYLNKSFNQLYGVNEEDLKEFWNKILLNSNNKIQESFIKFTQQKCNDFIKFYMLNNSLLNYSINMSDGVTFKKEILYEWIKAGTPAIYRNELFWDFILDIIKYVHCNDLKFFWKLINIDEIRHIPSNDDCKILKGKHFFEEMKSYIISELEYDYNKVFDQQKRLNFTTCIIKNSLDIDIIKKLADFWSDLSKKNYPGTNLLCSSIEKVIFMDKELMGRIEAIVAENKTETILNENIKKMIKHSEKCLF